MGTEQTAPTSSQNTASQPRRFQFSLKWLLIAICVVALGLAWMGSQMRSLRIRQEGQQIARELSLDAIVASSCSTLDLRRFGGAENGAFPMSDQYTAGQMWLVNPKTEVPEDLLDRLAKEVQRRLGALHVEVLEADPLRGVASEGRGGSSHKITGIQVSYRHRSVRGLVQFWLIQIDPSPTEDLRSAYLSGNHVQFR